MTDLQTKSPPTMDPQKPYSDALVLSKVSANHSSPRKRRSQQESEIEAMERKCALSGDRCWLTTGIPKVNATIREKTGSTDYYVKFLKYTTRNRKKGKMQSSLKFETKEEAMANLFQCRYLGETPASNKLVDEHLDRLINGLSPVELQSSNNSDKQSKKP